MKITSNLLTFSFFVLGFASAIPTSNLVEARKDIHFGPGQSHVFNKTGNLYVHVGDKKVNWGSWYPSFATGLMHRDSICPTPGQCYPTPFRVKSTYVDTGSFQGSVSVSPFSSYMDESERDTMLAALGKAMQITIGKPKVASASNCWYPPGTCDPLVNQWYTATKFEVAKQEPGGGQGSSIGLTATFDHGEDSGFCAEALALFGGLGGLVPEAGGYIAEGLSIASLICDA